MSDEDKIEENKMIVEANQAEQGMSEILEDKPNNIKSNMSYLFNFFLLVIICGLFVNGYFLWHELQKTKIDLAKIINNEQNQADLITGSLADIDNEIQQLKGKQNEQSEVLTSLYRDRQGNNEDWALAEIEYLLIIAMHRLLLEEDVSTALAAMSAADRRLKNLGDPGLLVVRRQLMSDMNQLRSVSSADTAGMAIYLADMISFSVDLPLKSEVVVEILDQTSPGLNQPADEIIVDPLWKRIPKILWQEIKSWVVIRRTREIKEALLLPKEEYFLYQNLRLQMEGARQSVLRSDSENLRASIDFIQLWLRQYFDIGDSAVVNVIETLDQMRSVELNPVLPDISSSLESLRAYIREMVTESADADGNQLQ